MSNKDCDWELPEVTAAEYGRMIFGAFTERYDPGSHWKSIQVEAMPHIEALLALNNKMKGGGYSIIGSKGSDGKPKMKKADRIAKAQELTWGAQIQYLKVGDQFWPTTDIFDIEMEPTECSPCIVESIDKEQKLIYVTLDRDRVERLKLNDMIVIKAPADFEEEGDYQFEKGRKFWLKKAKELGF